MRGQNFTARLIFGGLLILLGLGFLLDQISPFSFGWVLGTWWPLFVILFGVLMLARRPYHLTFGLLVILIGVMLEVSQLNLLPFNIWNLWPLFIVAIGISVLVRPQKYWEQKYIKNTSSVGEDAISESQSFSSVTKRVKTDKFTGGHISSVFGEYKLDLRESKIVDGSTLDVEAVFGSVEVWVPTNTKVINRIDTFAGNFDDHTATSSSDAVTLYVTGDVVFGNVKVL